MSATSLIGSQQKAVSNAARPAANLLILSPDDDLRTALASAPAGSTLRLTSGVHDISRPGDPLRITRNVTIAGEYGTTTLLVPVGVVITTRGAVGQFHGNVVESTVVQFHDIVVESTSVVAVVVMHATLLASNCRFTLRSTGLASYTMYAAHSNIVLTSTEITRETGTQLMASRAALLYGSALVVSGTVTFRGANQLGDATTDNAATLFAHNCVINAYGTLRVAGPVLMTAHSISDQYIYVTISRLVTQTGLRIRPPVSLMLRGELESIDCDFAIAQFFPQRSTTADADAVAAIIHASVAVGPQLVYFPYFPHENGIHESGDLDGGDHANSVDFSDLPSGSHILSGDIYASGAGLTSGGYNALTNSTGRFRAADQFRRLMPPP